MEELLKMLEDQKCWEFFEVFGGKGVEIRFKILHKLLEKREPVYIEELAVEIGIARTGLGKHLKKMGNIIRREERGGKLYYKFNTDFLDDFKNLLKTARRFV